MKHLFSTLVFVLFSLLSFSQITRGESYITGSLGINVKDDRNSFLSGADFTGAVKITSFSGVFNYQIFILPRFAIGPSFGWTYRKVVFDELIDANPFTFQTVSTVFNKQYEPGLTISYHIPITNRFNFYLSTTGTYIYIDHELQGDIDVEIQNGKGYKIDLRPGVYFFVTERKKLSIRMEVGDIYFSKIYPEKQPELFINEFNADFHPANFTLGAQWHFLRSSSDRATTKKDKKKN